MKYLLIYLCVIAATSLLQPRAFAQSKDPHIEWRQIETEHFVIVHDAKQYPLAEQYARFAEQAFQLASPAFGLWPSKTVVVIDDSSDVANGFATGLPYPMISLFPVLPSPLDSISDYGNWGLELITHEYVHILTFEPANGIMKPARWVLGTIVRPNIMLPRWYTEGLAVEMETRLSNHGRLRSANYLSIIRSMVEEGTLKNEDISRINETSIPDWPGGIRPYLMGALLWNEITSRGGEKAIGELNDTYSRRVPFLINGPIESLLGVDYQTLLNQVYDRVEKIALKQLELIRAGGNARETKISAKGFFNHSPAISPDGKKLVYISREHNVDSAINLIERKNDTDSFSSANSQSRKATDGESIGRASWSMDSKNIIFDSLGLHDRYYSFSDLYLYNLESKKKTQLTKGLRARDPVFSPNGQFIVFAQNLPGGMRLMAMPNRANPLAKDLVVLHEPPLQTRISRPEFISDDTLLFTEKIANGTEALKVLKLVVSETKELKLNGAPFEILSSYKPVHFPRVTKDGLLFVSDRSGVANLYLVKSEILSRLLESNLRTANPANSSRTVVAESLPENLAKAVTNATSRVMTGELDGTTGELLYSRLTSLGPQIFSTAREQWSQSPEKPPQVGPLVETDWPKMESPQNAIQAEATVQVQSEPYNALPHLLPRYWLPFVYLIPDGTYVQASTSNADPTGRHAYSIAAAYDTLTEKPSFIASYVNETTRVPVTLLVEDINEYIYSGNFVRHSAAMAASGAFFLPGLSNNWKGGLGWKYLDTELFGQNTIRNGLQASFSYNNASRSGYEISPESGTTTSVTHTKFFGQLGDLDYDQTDLMAACYFSKWLPERHAIALIANGTIAPQLKTSLLGRSTVGGNYQTGLSQSGFLMRGYSSGVFLGRNMVSGSFEYRFPLTYTYQGYGTAPFFVKRFHAAIFADTITLDGAAYSFVRQDYDRQTLGNFFWGSGLELKADATIFYHVPIQFTLGAYYGADQRYNPHGWTPFIGFGF